MNNKKELHAVLRQDFFSFAQKTYYEVDNSQEFIPSNYLKIMADFLQRCAEKKIKRGIINIPPRKLKSLLASIALPAWILGHNPNERVICVSYSQELASKFTRDCRKLMNAPFYKSVFSTRLNPDKQTERVLETTENGYRYATSVEGTLTGIGGNFIIVDDPIKASDAVSQVVRKSINDWYDNTLSSRLDNKKDGVIIIVMQRLHLDDLTGHIFKQDGWNLLSLPALANRDEKYILLNGKEVIRKAGEVLCPELEPLEEILRLKKSMTNYNFSAQYQQTPIPEKGNIIDFDMFKYYDTLPSDGKVYQSWDIAFKTGKNNDYSVCITAVIQGENIYIKDIYRDKIDIATLECEIVIQAQKHACKNIIIEATSSTELLIQNLAKREIYPIKYSPKDSKETRANYASQPMSYGQVYLKRNAPWIDDFKAEIVAFPFGIHDDQVDAFSQLIINKHKGSTSSNILEFLDKMVEYKYSEERLVRKYMHYKQMGFNKLL